MKLSTRLREMKIPAILITGIAPVVVRIALLPWMPVPAPRIHDEFSHLLLGDTIAHGRAVNRAHPLAAHFETMHVLSHPVYASPYPPAQGMLLAAGDVAMGIPWAGVLLSIGLMCAAITWMLEGWVSTRWALLGGCLAAARFGVLSYWMNSYYGGAVPAAAGALALGAVGRLIRRPRWPAAAILAFGIAVLANSRPFEGLVFTIGIAALLAWKLRTRFFQREILLPLAGILGVAALGMGWWFWTYTGSPIVMPYDFFRTRFTEVPHFWILPLRPAPHYPNRVLRDYYEGWEVRSYRLARENRPPFGVIDKIKTYVRFFAGPALGLAIAAAAVLGWRRSRVRWLLWIALLMAIASFVEVWHAPHYLAPALGAFMLLAVEGLRHLRQLRGGRWLVLAVCLASLATPVVQSGFRVGDGRTRQNVLRQMQARGGKHLLVVRYGLRHDPGDEWVYNGADLDGAPVIWARELGAPRNRALLDYYSDRTAWLVEPDVQPVPVTRYTGQIAEEWASHVQARLMDAAGGWPQTCSSWDDLYSEVTGRQAPACGASLANRELDLAGWTKWFEARSGLRLAP